MHKIIQFFKIDWAQQLVGLICFCLGVALGVILVSVLLKRLNLKDKDKAKEIKDVEYITKNAISTYENGKSKLSIEKIAYVSEAIAYLSNKISEEYGNSKLYKIINKEDCKIANKEILLSDLSLRLDFTVYELLGFINQIVEQIREVVYSLLNSNVGKVGWGVGKILFGKKLQDEKGRDLDGITVNALFVIVQDFFNKEEKQEGKLKSFFKPALDKAKDVASNVANAYLDKYVKDLIEKFAIELNRLYSGQLKRTTVKDLSQSLLEEGV